MGYCARGIKRFRGCDQFFQIRLDGSVTLDKRNHYNWTNLKLGKGRILVVVDLVLHGAEIHHFVFSTDGLEVIRVRLEIH